MTKLSINTILLTAATAAFAGQAGAADLSAATPIHKAPAVVAQVFNWTGFYVGANVGYGWSANNDGAQLSDFPPSAPTFAIGQTPTSLGFRQKGVIGGAEVGFNWQTASLVYGVEADISATDIKGSGTFFFPGSILGAPETTTVSSKLDWLSTIRGRLGFTPVDRLLIFGTAGVAFGQVNNALSVIASQPGFLAVTSGSNRSTRVGWVAGLGTQYAVTNDIFVKAEWLYYDLGTSSVSANEVLNGSITPTGFSSSVKTNGNIVRFGFDYRFGGPIVARY
jgi:outer membrane immunogenic protein